MLWECNECGERKCKYENPVSETAPGYCPVGIDAPTFLPADLPKADGYALLWAVGDEEAKEPIQNALYSTGRFTLEQCDDLADGILQYIKDVGYYIANGT